MKKLSIILLTLIPLLSFSQLNTYTDENGNLVVDCTNYKNGIAFLKNSTSRGVSDFRYRFTMGRWEHSSIINDIDYIIKSMRNLSETQISSIKMGEYNENSYMTNNFVVGSVELFSPRTDIFQYVYVLSYTSQGLKALYGDDKNNTKDVYETYYYNWINTAIEAENRRRQTQNPFIQVKLVEYRVSNREQFFAKLGEIRRNASERNNIDLLIITIDAYGQFIPICEPYKSWPYYLIGYNYCISRSDNKNDPYPEVLAGKLTCVPRYGTIVKSFGFIDGLTDSSTCSKLLNIKGIKNKKAFFILPNGPNYKNEPGSNTSYGITVHELDYYSELDRFIVPSKGQLTGNYYFDNKMYQTVAPLSFDSNENIAPGVDAEIVDAITSMGIPHYILAPISFGGGLSDHEELNGFFGSNMGQVNTQDRGGLLARLTSKINYTKTFNENFNDENLLLEADRLGHLDYYINNLRKADYINILDKSKKLYGEETHLRILFKPIFRDNNEQFGRSMQHLFVPNDIPENMLNSL